MFRIQCLVYMVLIIYKLVKFGHLPKINISIPKLFLDILHSLATHVKAQETIQIYLLFEFRFSPSITKVNFNYFYPVRKIISVGFTRSISCGFFYCIGWLLSTTFSVFAGNLLAKILVVIETEGIQVDPSSRKFSFSPMREEQFTMGNVSQHLAIETETEKTEVFFFFNPV